MFKAKSLFGKSVFVAKGDKQHSVARIATLNSERFFDAEGVEQSELIIAHFQRAAKYFLLT
jgi:hypothetical protein